jgi:putative tryptophan/tyrosine transport system substrate-binding protein
MRRREFISALGGAAVSWPLGARGQQEEWVRRVGVLLGQAPSDQLFKAAVATFLQLLKQSGGIEDRNMRLDIRWAAGNADSIQAYAAELVALAPDVILVAGTAAVGPLVRATRTVPIVFTLVPDPVGAGDVESLAHPGGNVTGFTNFEYAMGAKWLELAQRDRSFGKPGRGPLRCCITCRNGAVRSNPGSGALVRRGGKPNRCFRWLRD